MSHAPSPQQLAAFDRRTHGRVVLFCELRADEPGAAARCAEALARLAAARGARTGFAAREEETVCGKIPSFQRAVALHFRERADARAFAVQDLPGATADCTAVQVTALSEQPRMLKVVSAVMAAVLPHWPFDDTIAPGEEPGVDVSTVMPTSKTIAALRAHPRQDSPVTMINWLRFRPVAAYADGEPVSGRTAYHRYGKVAMLTTHSIGAKLVFAARYQQILVGNGGDPGLGLWDEFALMRYPGRRAFGRMASLARYRAALHHREAGLAEYGQGLTVSEPP
jgi:hypothetical protein